MRIFIGVLVGIGVLGGAGCQVKVEGDSCGDFLEGCEQGLVCNRAYSPPRCLAPGQAGELCKTEGDCADGLLCVDAACTAPAQEGEACAGEGGCAAGLVCNEALEPAACAAPGPAGAPCDDDGACQEGLSCNAAAEPAGCAPPAEEGGACATDSNCAEGLHCSKAVSPPACAPPSEEGAPCAADSNCREGLLCNEVLVPPACAPPGEEGVACKEAADCAEGLACNFGFAPGPAELGECHGPQAEGKPCMPLVPGLCEAGLVCVPVAPGGLQSDGLCREEGSGQKGDPCIGDSTCDEGLACHFVLGSSACVDEADVTVSGEGGPCGGLQEVCGDGLTCNRGYDPARCIAMNGGAAGDPCAFGADCEVGLLCNVGLAAPACVEPGSMAPGEPCEGPFLPSDAFCGEGASCNGAGDPVCVADGSLEVAAPCSEDDQCEAELLCAGNPRICTTPAGEGESCWSNRPCGKGLICKDASGGFGTCG